MKKLLVGISAIALCAAFIGCDDDDSPTKSSEEVSLSSSSSEDDSGISSGSLFPTDRVHIGKCTAANDTTAKYSYKLNMDDSTFVVKYAAAGESTEEFIEAACEMIKKEVGTSGTVDCGADTVTTTYTGKVREDYYTFVREHCIGANATSSSSAAE